MSQVQGGSRVDRYRHLAYEWLGVEKVELAVMAELLLRGAQTVGELRGRAARMEPIKDLGELQPTLDSLEAKGLIQYLTPPGRGSVVTHTLYLDREIGKGPPRSRRRHVEDLRSQRAEAPAARTSAAARERTNRLRPTHRFGPAAGQRTSAERARCRSGKLREELSKVQRGIGCSSCGIRIDCRRPSPRPGRIKSAARQLKPPPISQRLIKSRDGALPSRVD